MSNSNPHAQYTHDDDFDPELLCPGIEEEEEEEEEEVDLDDDQDGAEEEDRGDQVDPSLTDDDEQEQEQEQDDEEGDDYDPEALAELADDGKKSATVPHARFNEVNAALKREREARLQLEEELARARGAASKPDAKPENEQPAAYDFDNAEDRYAEALMDGDKELARAIRAEIRAEERKAFEAEGAKAARMTAAEELRQRDQLAEQDALAKVAAESIAKYPFLDPQSAAANEDAIEDVVARRNYYIQQGMAPSKALALAVDKAAPRYAKPAAKSGAPSATEDQIRRNLERSSRIPQTPAGVGERGKDIDYAKLSEDEFDALSAEDKRRARGDYVKEA